MLSISRFGAASVLSTVVLIAIGCTNVSGEDFVSSEDELASPRFVITTSSNTQFDATARKGGRSLRARVEYTRTTTLFEIITSSGRIIAKAGTAKESEAALPDDPQRKDGVLLLDAGDSDRSLVAALLSELERAGARPDPEQPGSTLYAAAYFAARALGEVPVRRGDRPSKTFWPYPGFNRKADIPAELQVAPPGPTIAFGFDDIPCCGPYNCVNADWNPNVPCDDWCAAGDACNAWGWGECGTSMFFPKGGCNWCPHSNSRTILSRSPAGCNNGTCTPSCWDEQPTHNGPASNFCNYGKVFFGDAGGENGTGDDDHWF